MFKAVKNHEIIAEASARKHVVAAGPNDLHEAWLDNGKRVAIPEVTGGHLDPDHCQRLVSVLNRAGEDSLIAITNDPLVDDDEVYELSAHEDDLSTFSWELAGLDALLLPRTGTEFAVVCSVDDFHLVAGPRQFVIDYVGDLSAARTEFLEAIETHFDLMQPTLRKAAKYMNWIEGDA